LYNQAKRVDEKRHYFEKLTQFKESKITILNEDCYEYFTKWFYVAIRELLYFHPFKGDYVDIAQKLVPHITVGDAKKAIALLQKLGLIKENEHGDLVRSDAVPSSTGYDVKSMAIEKFVVDTLELSKNAFMQFGSDERLMWNLTLSLSDEGFKTISEKIKRFSREILEVAQNDTHEKKVYHINCQMFPFSK